MSPNVGLALLLTYLMGWMLWLFAQRARPPRSETNAFIKRLRRMINNEEFRQAFQLLNGEMPGIHPQIACLWILGYWIEDHPGYAFAPMGLFFLLRDEGGFPVQEVTYFDDGTLLYFAG